jgi:antitoxin component YwqK of YwqJK toxin-antitoxin module
MRNVTLFRIMALFVACTIGGAVAFGAAATQPSEDYFAQATRTGRGTYFPLGKTVSLTKYYRNDEVIGERVFYANGAVAEERQIRDNRRHGTLRQFYESGKLFAERPYENGKLHGTVRFFKETGELLGESKFEHGTGTLREYRLGTLYLYDRVVSYRNGLEEGISREWMYLGDGAGVRCTIGTYVHGEIDGWQVVFRNGSLQSSAYVKHGQIHGVYREFDDGGKPAEGFPKYVVKNKEVAEERFRELAKSDAILAKSLNDDGRHAYDDSLLRIPE